MQVAGVDGCPAGWAIVWVEVGPPLRLLSVRTAPDFGEVLRRTDSCDAVGIDIPIGLSDDGQRAPDIAARRVLSPLRHNSVFPSPVRAVLGATSYREACEISSRARKDGKKISKQTYFMTLRIADVDRHMTPSVQGRVFEVHPEVCFWALNNAHPLEHYKQTSEGQHERVALLSRAFANELDPVDVPPGVAPDDFLDACAAAWTAGRIALGTAQRLPSDPPLDARGLRMEIVY